MSAALQPVWIDNGAGAPWASVPDQPVQDWVEGVSALLADGGRLCALFEVPEGPRIRLVGVVAHDEENLLAVTRSEPFRGSYRSLTPRHAQAHLFEREVWEACGIVPEGHAWLKPVRASTGDSPDHGEFFRVEGAEVHEVAVGPVHAGIIEPGHFRFQCAGEEVLHLEIGLGYQHRGIERALVGGPHRGTRCQMETAAGDSTVAHATAHAMVHEALAATEPPLRSQWLRAVALELERLANHTGDLGALANDVAFLPTSAACGRIRGDFLNLTAALCGNRFGRHLVKPGGCSADPSPGELQDIRRRLEAIQIEVERAAGWLWEAASVRARFEGVGVVTSEQAAQVGLVGPAARASGLVRDVRFDHPSGWYRVTQIPVAVWPEGDVFARARVRWLEMRRSLAFLLEQLSTPPAGRILTSVTRCEPGCVTVALVEGWRGEVCHVALTDEAGRYRRYKIVDPSFHNWTGLALALRGQAISDFPLCNKSFNLSYCGFDL